MTNPTLRQNVQHGMSDLDAQANAGTLPAVTFLEPGDDDGHPGYSTLAAFENFATHAVDEVQNNPQLWKNTAIFVTFDEGGGYLDQLPNPTTRGNNPYVPVNGPAIGDMFDYFDFSGSHASGKPTEVGDHGGRQGGAPVANTGPSLR
jgi:phospholipase C